MAKEKTSQVKPVIKIKIKPTPQVTILENTKIIDKLKEDLPNFVLVILLEHKIAEPFEVETDDQSAKDICIEALKNCKF